jgi:hypothetical protein
MGTLATTALYDGDTHSTIIELPFEGDQVAVSSIREIVEKLDLTNDPDVRPPLEAEATSCDYTASIRLRTRQDLGDIVGKDIIAFGYGLF